MEKNNTIIPFMGNVLPNLNSDTTFTMSDTYWENSGLLGILTRCCAAFGVTVDQAKSRVRKKNVVLARQAYCYMAYRNTQQSIVNIGKLIGRNHSTVTYAIHTVKTYLDINYRHFTDIYNMLLVD